MAEVNRDRASASDDPLIGFLGFEVVPLDDPAVEGVVRGAVLITDRHGDPREFQVATPVRANRVQRALWADRLTQHAIARLITAPLLKELQTAPTVMLTHRAEALEVQSSWPMLHVAPESDAAASNAAHRSASVAGERCHFSIALTCADADFDQALRLLSQLGELPPLFSVFDRIREAIKELAETDDRYR